MKKKWLAGLGLLLTVGTLGACSAKKESNQGANTQEKSVTKKDVKTETEKKKIGLSEFLKTHNQAIIFDTIRSMKTLEAIRIRRAIIFENGKVSSYRLYKLDNSVDFTLKKMADLSFDETKAYLEDMSTQIPDSVVVYDKDYTFNLVTDGEGGIEWEALYILGEVLPSFDGGSTNLALRAFDSEGQDAFYYSEIEGFDESFEALGGGVVVMIDDQSLDITLDSLDSGLPVDSSPFK